MSTTNSASGSAASSSPAPSTPAGSASSSAATKLPLIVLNNTTIRHLARDASARFEAGGWTVTRFDNYQNDILSTCAYYDPDNPQAKAAAQALQRQYPTIKRVRPKFDGLPDGPIVVILTPDYTP